MPRVDDADLCVIKSLDDVVAHALPQQGHLPEHRSLPQNRHGEFPALTARPEHAHPPGPKHKQQIPLTHWVENSFAWLERSLQQLLV